MRLAISLAARRSAIRIPTGTRESRSCFERSPTLAECYRGRQHSHKLPDLKRQILLEVPSGGEGKCNHDGHKFSRLPQWLERSALLRTARTTSATCFGKRVPSWT